MKKSMYMTLKPYIINRKEKMVTKKDIEDMGFTQITQIGYSQSFIANKSNAVCYLSYRSIIGIYDQVNKQNVFTDNYYSITTSRHRNKFIKDCNGIVDNDRFNELLKIYYLSHHK